MRENGPECAFFCAWDKCQRASFDKLRMSENILKQILG